MLVRSTASTLSGYGTWARQLIYSIIKSPLYDNFDVRLLNVNWGQTPLDALDPHNEINDTIRPLLDKPGFDQQPDIFITQTIPNEFERVGKYLNVGVTAACESDRISLNWINKINENCDVLLAISNFTAAMMSNTFYNKKLHPDGEVLEEIRIKRPTGVWNPVVDTKIFRPGIRCKLDLNLTTTKNFLFVGHWLKGDYGKDRKNVGVLLRTFLQTFLGVQDVGLILKVSGASFSPVDFDEIQKKINIIKKMVYNPESKELPKVYLIHGDLTNEEMCQLYNHPSIISYVAVHHGEGWGLPLCEAMACNVPSIQVPWSGNTDFLIQDGFFPVNYVLQEIPDECLWDDIFIKSAKWACIDEKMLSQAMAWVYENPSEARKVGVKGGDNIRNNFSLDSLQFKTNVILKSFLDIVNNQIVDPNKIPFKEI